MENTVEKSRKLVASRSNVTKTIVKLATQLEELSSFERRKYIQDAFPELDGSAYIQKVAELRDESDWVTKRLESLLTNLDNQYLSNLRYDLEEWLTKQNHFHHKVTFSWSELEMPRAYDNCLIMHRLHFYLSCKFYTVQFSIGIPISSKELEITVFIKPKHKSADIDAQIDKMCEGQHIMHSDYRVYKQISFPIDKGLKNVCSFIKRVTKEMPKFGK